MPRVFVSVDEAWPVYHVSSCPMYKPDSVWGVPSMSDWEWEAELTEEELADLAATNAKYKDWQARLAATAPRR
jgi:hypothetical protein